MNWDDLRFFLAVAREGSLSAAARSLSVNHATVMRRLRALETALDATLFDRRPDGYGLTPAGEEILAHAERMEEEAIAVDRRITGRDVRLAGDVRVTTVDTIADLIVAPELPEFGEAFPGITIEVSTTDVWVNLSRREADIAIRPANDPGDTMVGRRVGRLPFSVYASSEYLQQSPVDDLAGARVVQSEGSLMDTEAARWFRRQTDGARISSRATSYLTQRVACMQSVGIACLPEFAAGGLVQVAKGPESIGVDLWLLTHPELRKTARIRVVLDWLAPVLGRATGT